MKALITILLGVVITLTSYSQMGEIWPVDSRQDFDVDAEFNITNEYEKKVVCQFFMFINDNEFIHVTDNVTSLYKITARDLSVPGEPVYTVISEAGNTYMYLFNKEKKEILAYSTKGFAISFLCLTPYNTYVFPDIDE
ncbi:hypothetical protein [Parvicella tangerina]|uniref:Uncharacterized protein n=1 Tax=Parvicella tangerina TaxID=2829795 RepID=A0A916JKQ8_9FLAO|nr:hypothetical protein [Parvicella tangerina]CAG5076310.1 hypothetical protein CRYO30217_00059 [Parvicella tangerina]